MPDVFGGDRGREVEGRKGEREGRGRGEREGGEGGEKEGRKGEEERRREGEREGGRGGEKEGGKEEGGMEKVELGRKEALLAVQLHNLGNG